VEEFLIYAAIGFGAQLIDGALGMGFGVIASVVMISTGVSPATSSAGVHTAKSFTTAAAGASNIYFKNVAWELFASLAVAGVIGGIVGATLLSHAEGAWVLPVVSIYLALMGGLIFYRAVTGSRISTRPRHVLPTGFFGGLLDAIGGGGWGPITVTTLLSRGGHPRYIIGSVNLAEFFVSVAVMLTFFQFGAVTNLAVVAGLVSGGIIAAPFAGYIVKNAPTRPLQFAVGILVISLAGYNIWRVLA
jgi:uncharacterized membrane protein YfcA